MLHPSYSELMAVVNEDAATDQPIVNSRYSIVMATAKRARQIIQDKQNALTLGKKPLSVAVDELSKGKISILSEE